MTFRRFNRPDMSSAYDRCRRASGTRSSIYLTSQDSTLSPVDRVAYWRGRAGLDNIYGIASTAYACWAAGQDDHRSNLSKEVSP